MEAVIIILIILACPLSLAVTSFIAKGGRRKNRKWS